MDVKTAGLDTRLVHAGEEQARVGGALVAPIFQASVWSVEETGYEGLKYPRYNNLPNQTAVAAKLAILEGAETAEVASSGMAAISASLLAVLAKGDHLLVLDCLYGGTHTLITKRFPTLGIAHDLIAGDDPASWAAKLRPETKAIYVETISNPLTGVPELDAVVAFAREHGLVCLVDNTFATPIDFRPAERGFDLSLHSCTKYLNGHSDLIAGAVIGSREMVDKVRDHQAPRRLPRPARRVPPATRHEDARAARARQGENALALARHLEAHPAVVRVRHPGLPSHPDHERATRLLNGYGAMLAFEVAGGGEAADRFFSRVRLATHAPSLGGLETLVVSPARSSHVGLKPEEREALGITDALVRVSVGIESLPDLIADFDQALGP